jgi:hypothetical protein
MVRRNTSFHLISHVRKHGLTFTCLSLVDNCAFQISQLVHFNKFSASVTT